MADVKNGLKRLLPLLLIAAVSGLVFFVGYDRPAALFWDENYHIASAQKYVDGVMFMEPHPPLGKLFIAAGEALFGANRGLDTFPFLATDYISEVPGGYSFAGVRFFPVFFAACSALLVFLILKRIFADWKFALVFSALYVFDNAIVVHSRGAMLEGIQLFFVLAAVLVFVRAFQSGKESGVLRHLSLGALIGLACAVKVNAAVLFLLFPFQVWEDLSRRFGRPEFIRRFPFVVLKDPQGNPIKRSAFAVNCGRIGLRLGIGLCGAALAFLIPFYIHFSLGQSVAAAAYYNASPEYREALADGATADPRHFPAMLGDYFGYMDQYQKGVPRWDPAKPGENGSPAWAWPFGYKSINYRWERSNNVTSYLYLQINPVVWYASLAGTVLALVFALGRAFFKTPVPNRGRFRLICCFLILYGSYMAVMVSIARVLYLYHYFIPLMISFFILALVFRELFAPQFEQKSRLLLATACAFALLVILVFLFFSPLTYYVPLDEASFRQRVWTDLWGLVPVAD